MAAWAAILFATSSCSVSSTARPIDLVSPPAASADVMPMIVRARRWRGVALPAAPHVVARARTMADAHPAPRTEVLRTSPGVDHSEHGAGRRRSGLSTTLIGAGRIAGPAITTRLSRIRRARTSLRCFDDHLLIYWSQ
jgi:hypothetical protein